MADASEIGRPTKLTPEIHDLIVKAVTLGSTYLLASQSAGITYKTFREWMLRGEADESPFSDFSNAIEKAKGDRVSTWLQHIENAAEKGTWTAAAWKLERIYPDDFGKQDRISVSHSPQLVTFQWQPQLEQSQDASDVLEGNYTLLADTDNEEPED